MSAHIKGTYTMVGLGRVVVHSKVDSGLAFGSLPIVGIIMVDR